MLGIPTAISFDIVKVDDKLGVRFEMLDCSSLKEACLAHPERIHEYLIQYAALLKKMNTTECLDPNIPDKKQEFLRKVEKIKQFLPEKAYEKCKKLISELPDRKTLIHGDCHFKNIMLQKNEMLLIDMDTLSVGYPIFELAALYFAYCGFNESDHENSMKFFGIKEEDARALFNGLVSEYFGKIDQDIVNKIRIVAYIQLIRWNRNNEPENEKRFLIAKQNLLDLLDKYDDLDIGL